MKIVKLFFLIFSFTFLQCLNPTAERQILQPRAFLKALKSHSNPLIIDVRSREEFQNGHLESALNINWNSSEFENIAHTWNPNVPVFVYCLSGGRSAAAAEFLRQQHFKTVFELQGGLMAWRSAQLPEQGIIKKNGMTVSDFNEGLKSKKDSVLVDFYADWCKPCQLMKPDIADIQHNFDSRIDVWRIDADAETELCRNLNIDALPVLQLYVNGKRTWEHRGYIKASKLREVLGLR
jgi:thioredoxin 1